MVYGNIPIKVKLQPFNYNVQPINLKVTFCKLIVQVLEVRFFQLPFRKFLAPSVLQTNVLKTAVDANYSPLILSSVPSAMIKLPTEMCSAFWIHEFPYHIYVFVCNTPSLKNV